MPELPATEIIKLLVFGVAAIVSAPVVVTLVKAVYFIGRMTQLLDSVRDAVPRVEKKVDVFIERCDTILRDHEARLIVAEAESSARDRA